METSLYSPLVSGMLTDQGVSNHEQQKKVHLESYQQVLHGLQSRHCIHGTKWSVMCALIPAHQITQPDKYVVSIIWIVFMKPSVKKIGRKCQAKMSTCSD